MKPRPQIVDRVLQAIEASKTICVVGHIRPDGDCIGSQLGLAIALVLLANRVAIHLLDYHYGELSWRHSLDLPTPPMSTNNSNCWCPAAALCPDRTSATCSAVVGTTGVKEQHRED